MSTTGSGGFNLDDLLNDARASWRYYHYDVNRGAAIAVAAIFFVFFLTHLWLLFRKKAYYMWPFAFGVGLEVAGYVLRRISADHPSGTKGLPFFVAQNLAVILGPAFMAASHYMTFGRLVKYVSQKYTPVSAKWVTVIFVTFDVVSILVQGGGGSLFASEKPNIYKIAKAILLVGFIIQIIAFGIFGIFGVVYQIRARRDGENSKPWQYCLYTLYAGCVLILIRGIFRTIEFGSGSGGGRGYLLENEGFYYGLEALPIILATFLFIVSHPSRYIPSDTTVLLHPENRDYEEQIEKAGARFCGCGRRKDIADYPCSAGTEKIAGEVFS